MFYQKTIQHYFLTISVILMAVGNCFKVTATEIVVPREQNSRGDNNAPVAQLPPEQPEPVPPPQLEPLPPAEELLDIPTLTPPPSTAPEFPRTISIQKFNVTGNTILGEEIDEVLQNFLNRPLTFAELLETESAITQLYVENGYINSGAVIPAGQTLEDGTVRIQVVEGSIEEIVISGSGGLDPGYIRSRLRLATQTPLNANQIQEALQLLRQDPLIENIQAELSVGTSRDKSILTVDVRRADPFKVQVQADNSRAPSVGTFQRGVQLSHGNLLGRGDALAIGYRNTEGSNRYEAGYAFPINPRNGTISFSFSQSDNDIIEPPFDELDIESTTRSYELTFRQPIARNATPNFLQEIALGLTGSHQQSETTLDGDPFPISLGADASGNTRISALRFFQDWTRRDRRQVFAARSQFSLGVDAFDATINDDDPDSRFFAWRGQFQYLRQIGSPDTTLLFRSDLQFAASNLLPLEQFGIGGIYSVRGYRQDALLTDSGIFASAEVRLPVWRWNQVEGLLSVIPFIDFALGWNGGDRESPDPNNLISVGLGLQWQMSDKLRLRFDYGIPLVDIDSRDRTWQENGLYFFVEYNGF